MGMFSMSADGDTKNLEKFLENAAKPNTIESRIRSIADAGVRALQAATPVESGATAMAWSYEIVRNRGSIEIFWKNSHMNKGQHIAVLLQYGHGTGTGGYVQGRDYINPAMRPIFDQMANEAWKAVTSA